jgi:eukaryotic-like serine/threonine-protein kinase
VIGRTLAHYKIDEKIGAGGMGEVYRASDAKLGRNVALKVLPEVFARDPERMARFAREAQLLASLNHPNIAAIYGLEEDGDRRALVLELVEGPTLADRLADGPIPLGEALPIAAQIAEALEAAHEKGIVHRDLKPANVKLGVDGRVKVLDFGLAKALEDPATSMSGSSAGIAADSPTISPSLSPTITGALTGANVILGTAAYMSPEQARGHSVDKRCDIWAFGVILWEMLAGRRLFDGETVSDTLADVLKTEPDWDAVPRDTPPRIRRLLRRCLAKKPRERLRDIGDARLAITEVLSGVAEAEEPAGAAGGAAAGGAGRARRRWVLPAVAVVAAVVGATVASLLRTSAPSPEAPLRKYELSLPAGARLGGMALAPDGSAVAFVQDGKLQVRALTGLETRELAETSEVEAPFWSPDDQWIAYGSASALWKVPRTGGAPTRIAALNDRQTFTSVAGGVWHADGRIFFTSGNGGVFEVSAQGGDPTTAIEVGPDASDFHHLADLGGRAWAVIVHRKEGYDTIAALLPDGTRKVLVQYPGESLYDLSWSPSGYLLFRRTGPAAGVWALPVSLAGVAVAAGGDPFLVAPGAEAASVASDGTLAYLRSVPRRETSLAVLDRSGRIVQTLGQPAAYAHFPVFSPDGRQVACRIHEGDTRNLWVIDLERGARGRFTHGPGSHNWGTWDATGREFWYYNETLSDDDDIYVMDAGGAGEPRVVTKGWLPNPSPDGHWLLFARPTAGTWSCDIWVLDLRTEGAEPRKLVATPANEFVPAPSPTDPLVAYSTDGSGRFDVYLTTYPEVHGNWLASTAGGWIPRWRGDGRELFYAVGDSIMSVDVDPGDGTRPPHVSRASLVFRRPRYVPQFTGFPDGFDVTSDGQTFVLNVGPESDANARPPSIVVVQNWRAEF